MCALPTNLLSTHHFEDEPAKWHDEASLLSYQNELAGPDRTLASQIPTRQCFDRADGTGRKLNYWLEVHIDRALFDRRPKRTLESLSFFEADAHRWAIERCVTPALRFRSVHSDVSVRNQFIRVDQEMARSNADAATHVHSLVKNRERLRERSMDGCCKFTETEGGRGRVVHDNEFVAAETGAQGSIVNRRAQSSANIAQQLVADLVAPGIVHNLEWIEVDE